MMYNTNLSEIRDNSLSQKSSQVEMFWVWCFELHNFGRKKHILQNFRHLSWLRLLQLWWPAVGWAGKRILPTTDETNTCLKTVSKNCLRCIFCLGRHVHHTAVTPSASKTAMEAPKLMVYLDIFPVSKCQVPCYESYSSPKKKQLITFY